jgi:hypothetical protein
MSSDADPPRLLDRPPDDLLGDALRGASEDLPSHDRVEAMLLRFPAGPTGGGGGGGTGGPAHPVASGFMKSAAAKVLAGVMLGSAVSAIVIVATQGEKTAATSSAALPAPPSPSAAVAIATVEPSASAAVPSASSPIAAPPSARAVVPSPSASAPVRSEIDLLREAQASVGSNPSHALAVCDEHARSYPNGQLGQERELIRIQALAALGRTSEAQAAADAFKARHPGSAYSQRIDEIVGQKH